VIVHDGVANKEYFSYGFDAPRPARPTIATGLHGGERTSGPDQAALDQIYRRDLLEYSRGWKPVRKCGSGGADAIRETSGSPCRMAGCHPGLCRRERGQ
jgi:hypothetical protein